MRKINSISLAVISMCAATVAFSSCQPEEIKGSEESRYVTLDVSAEGIVETKAADGSYESYDLSEGDDLLFVGASVAVNTMDPFTQYMTKGTITDEGTIRDAQCFNLSMSWGQSGYAMPSEMSHWAVYTDKDKTSKIEWPECNTDTEYEFLAHFLSNANSTFDPSALAYVGPSADVDASGMSDLVIANTIKETHYDDKYHPAQYNVPIHFFHPLAAVRFNVNGETVKKVTINKLKKDGEIAFTDDVKTDDGGRKYRNVVEWKNLKNEVSYSQTFSSANASETFFLIPQLLDDVTISFDMERADGTVYQITAKVNNLGTTSWDAGFIYTYTVDTTKDGNVSVRVKEEWTANSNRKEHVQAASNTRSTEYVRAFVVGNWCLGSKKSDNGIIVAPWNGNIVYNEGDDWFKGDDGFFYFKNPLLGYESSTDLVTKYVEDNATRPEGRSDLHLELHVLVQAVEWDADKKAVSKAWGTVVADKLN